jgi:GNAT superfamily N-acetyltransferase
MSSLAIGLAETDTDIARCFPVMVQLRPHLVEADFVARIRRMAAESYRLAFLTDETGVVRSVGGHRLMDRLHAGRMFYVDDLVTDAATRSRGHGDRLFDWLVARARALGCDEFALDSGTQRVEAHRFYLRKRMKISAFHFSFSLKTPPKA